MRRAATLLLLLVSVPCAAAHPDAPLRVTTDSSAYCTELASRLEGQPRAVVEQVRSLAAEGQRLCDTGHVRTGIAKLRRALRATQPGS